MIRAVLIAFLVLVLGSGPSVARADRVLHFPEDISLGWITFGDAPAQSDGADFSGNRFRGDWGSLRQAQGDVVVPDGKLVWLTLTDDVWLDPDRLVALTRLGPDDVFGLSTHASAGGVLKPNDRCMPYIAHLTGLRVLSMWSTNVTDRGAACLANLTRLESLMFGGRISEAGLSPIQAIRSLRDLTFSSSDTIDGALLSLGYQESLEALALNGSALSGHALEHLDNFPALRHLRLWGDVTEGALLDLDKAVHLTTLRLEMQDSINEDVIAKLAALEQLKTLKFQSELDDQACVYLAQLPQLEELDLAYRNKITDVGAGHLAQLGSLKRLSLNSVPLTDKGFEFLAQLDSLEALSVRVPELSEEGLGHLASMQNLKRLTLEIETLACSDAFLGESLHSLGQLETLAMYMPVSESCLVPIAEIPGLTRLSIQLKSDATNRVFSEVGKLEALRHLSLDCRGQLSTGGLSYLNGLSQLERLYLRGLKRDDTAMDISGLVNLKVLNVQMTFKREGKTRLHERFTDDDLACLAGLTKLERLQLGSPGVGDEGVAYLTKLKHLHYFFTTMSAMSDNGLYHLSQLDSLSQLTIRSGQFTDEGVAHLQNLKRLTMLDLTSTQGISGKTVQDLQERLPRLNTITIDSPQLTMK